MIKHEYLNWMATHTASQWCNDSALSTDIEAALEETWGGHLLDRAPELTTKEA